jgi:hypothetical protein
VQEILNARLIQHSSSPFCSPVLLVKKKGKTYRFCVDYRQLNAITFKGQYHVIDEMLNELSGASWFFSLDLCAGFHQIHMNPADCFKSAFQTHVGHYEFNVMSFGLTGAPHTFQRAINSSLEPLLRKCVFFYDIVVFNKSYHDHVLHLELVFELLQHHQWRVKCSKCSFAQREISYLGYNISEHGISTSPGKTQVVAD